jgi:hypothetical protein
MSRKFKSTSKSRNGITFFGAATFAGIFGSITLSGLPSASVAITYDFTALGFLSGGSYSIAEALMIPAKWWGIQTHQTDLPTRLVTRRPAE